MTDNLHTDKVREKLFAGIKKVSTAIGGTMGTSGANSIIECIESPGHLVTNDGFSIANSIVLEDPIENMGKNILLESINRANKQSGDGSSTTAVLTSAIIEEGMKHIGEVSPMEIKRSLEACIPLIEQSINAQKREITVDEVGAVAAISAEDEKIGAMIQEIYQQIGKEGIIHWDISKDFEDHYTIGKGITINWAGMVSPYMADLSENGQFLPTAKWNNVHVLLTRQKITSAADFGTLFEAMFNKDIKEIVVFCDEYEPNIVADLIRTRAVRGFKTLLVKMPQIWKDQWYEDLAKATGATIIDPNAGTSFKLMNMTHLGKVEHITVTKDETFIDGMNDMSEHIKALEADGTDDNKLRASRLNTKTARYFVGAHSDSALAYRRLKVEDAISAGWQALQNGVVPGGGVSLRDVSVESESIGGTILSKALRAPFNQILSNANITTTPTWIVGLGYDTRTRDIVSMFYAKITDPANVVLNSVKNAISVAASVLTAETIVTLPRTEQPVTQPPYVQQ